MILEIEKAVAKITSVTPISEKHGRKRVPAHSIIFEVTRDNTILIPFDPQLRASFYQKVTRGATDKKGQKQLDVTNSADGLTELKFPWWTQPINVPGELVGYLLTLHTGNTERSHIVLDDAKISDFWVLPKDLGTVVLKMKALVHPSATEKGKIDELLQQEVPISIAPPTSTQSDLIGHASHAEPGDEEDGDGEAEEGEQEAAGPQSAAPGEAPIEDPFAGTDLARGAVKSDAVVKTKRTRRAAPADKHAEGAWPFPR